MKKGETESTEQKQIFSSLEENYSYISDSFNHTSDLKKRNFIFNKKRGMVVYLETMTDTEKIKEYILVPLSKGLSSTIHEMITAAEIEATVDLNYSLSKLLDGMSILFIESSPLIYLIATTNTNITRSPDEPTNEKIVRGSHEGFVENININLYLIRKKIKNRQLIIKYMELGRESNTKVALVFMEGLADPSVIEMVEQRLHSISSDMIFSPGYIEEFIEDSNFSPFPQILYTERPDRVMAQLMDGRVALLADGSADVMILPVSFFVFFQSPDDYNSRIYTGSFFRFIRLISFFVSLTFPSIYIAVIAFNFEVIPNDIVVLVKGSVEGIPYPPLIEALIMVFTIELIREAGVRLPTPIGQTIGIVGGLILGDAVVSAGLISNFMIIIIAITAVSSFTIPSYELSSVVRILTFPLMIAASSLGVFGISIVLMFIAAHLCKLESFGKPYFSPFAPLYLKDLKDTFIRAPIKKMNTRPNNPSPKRRKRQNNT